MNVGAPVASADPVRLERPVRVDQQSWPEGACPAVSICCWTYNQKNFLRQTLEGFLMQKTTFPVEIIVHDDASTDGTADIVREYRDRFPRLIRVILQEKNQYSQTRFAFIGRVFAEAKGEFLALCEGDDYWTDEDKLERQHAILSGDASLALCLHQAVEKVDSTGEEMIYDRVVWERISLKECLDFHDFTNPYNVTPGHTSSAMFRRDALGNCWDIVMRTASLSADMPLFILLLRCGDAVYLNKPMTVYRIHGAGVSSRREHKGASLFTNRIQMYRTLLDELPQSYEDQIIGIIRLYKENIWLSRLTALRRSLVSFLPDWVVRKVRREKSA